MSLRILAAAAGLAVALPAAAQSDGDPVMGQKQFGQCAVCHSFKAGDPDKIGPNLFGVFGSKAASRRPKYAYSAALKMSGLTWDAATLDKWIAAPGETVKGTKMEFVGLPRKPARDNVIAYLMTLK